jgi:hypothetical protein
MALQKLFGERAAGHDVLRSFDLVAANSGGSVVVGALAENMPLDRLLEFFQTSDLLFPKEPWFASGHFYHWLTRRLLRLGPKYDTRKKLSALLKLMPDFGSVKLTEVPQRIEQTNGQLTHFLIVGFDYDWKRAKFFRSNADSLANSSGPTEATLAEAIHASSTAPVNYFNAPARLSASVSHGNRFWDGAITGHNNPVLAAVTEALANGQGLLAHSDIRVLSLGTGNVTLPVVARPSRQERGLVDTPGTPGLFHDLRELSESILDDPPDSASFEAWIMLGNPVPPLPAAKLLAEELRQHPEPVSLVRMNPLLRPVKDTGGNWRPPDGLTREEFVRLTNIDIDARVPRDVTLLLKFARAWLNDRVPNQPIRENPYTFEARIGHTSFSDALEAWQARGQSDIGASKMKS